MVALLHEVWEDSEKLHVTVCLAGPDGDKWRACAGEDSHLVATFEAHSYADAMKKYHAMYDLGKYSPFDSSAFEPYPEEWKTRQINAIKR